MNTNSIFINAEVADDYTTLAKGLMFRKDLPTNDGMLFKFNGLTEARFWGLNTYIPLDIAFVDNENTIIDINNIVPHSTKHVHSAKPCLMAIETNYGFFKNNNIGIGDKIEIDKSEKNAKIKFIKNEKNIK